MQQFDRACLMLFLPAAASAVRAMAVPSPSDGPWGAVRKQRFPAVSVRAVCVCCEDHASKLFTPGFLHDIFRDLEAIYLC